MKPVSVNQHYCSTDVKSILPEVAAQRFGIPGAERQGSPQTAATEPASFVVTPC